MLAISGRFGVGRKSQKFYDRSFQPPSKKGVAMFNSTVLSAALFSIGVWACPVVSVAQSNLTQQDPAPAITKTEHILEAIRHLRAAGLSEEANRLETSLITEFEDSIDNSIGQLLAEHSAIRINDMSQKIVNRAGRLFNEKRLPGLLEEYRVTSLAQLDERLAEKATSVRLLKLQFVERVLADELERAQKTP